MAIDLKVRQKELYAPSALEVSVVEVPAMRFLAIDGAGDPNTAPAYGEAVAALYAASYALKALRKRQPGAEDYVVLPLEGLWWMAGGAPYSPDRKEDFRWTLLIRQPDDAADDALDEAREAAARKKALPALPGLYARTLHEGRAAQILHIGPYADEGPTIAALHDAIARQGLAPRGKHHEIYLSDPARVPPARLKTILRQPVA